MESITGKHRASNKIRSWSELGMREYFDLILLKEKLIHWNTWKSVLLNSTSTTNNDAMLFFVLEI